MHEPSDRCRICGDRRDVELSGNAFIDGAIPSGGLGQDLPDGQPRDRQDARGGRGLRREDVDFAVAKAKAAFDDGRWRQLAPGDRKAVLLKLAKLMEENRHELAVLESLDSGKPIRECQTVDVPDTIHTIRWHAELIDKIYDNTAPVATSRTCACRARADRAWSASCCPGTSRS